MRNVVVTSSMAAITGGGETPGTVLTEADWNTHSSATFLPYYYSKLLAERAAWAFVKGTDMRVVCINPWRGVRPQSGWCAWHVCTTAQDSRGSRLTRHCGLGRGVRRRASTCATLRSRMHWPSNGTRRRGATSAFATTLCCASATLYAWRRTLASGRMNATCRLRSCQTFCASLLSSRAAVCRADDRREETPKGRNSLSRKLLTI